MISERWQGAVPPVGGPWRYLGWLVRSQRVRIAVGALLGSTWMVSLTVPPFLLSRAIDDGLRTGDRDALLMWVLVLLLASIVQAWLSIMRHRTMTRVRVDAAYRSVTAVTEHAVSLGATLPRRVRAGEVLTIGLADVWAMARALTITGPGVGAAIAYIVIAVLLLSLSPLLAAVVLLGVPVVAIIVGPLFQRVQRATHSYRNLQADLTGRMVDLVGGLGVLNGLGGKDFYAERYRSESQTLLREGYRVGRVTSWVQALGVALPALFLAVVIWLAARLAVQGTITVGELVAVYGYVAVLVVPVSFFIEGGLDLGRALVSARRVVEFLAVRPDAGSRPKVDHGPPGPAPLTDPDSGVVLEPHTLTAIVSARQSDSTALVDRLSGLAPITEATWGDRRLDTIDPILLRGRILVADNDATLFAGSLRAVISGRYERDEETVTAALHAAVADDIVDGLGAGLEAPIATRGRNLSGGQQQRVRMARALAADPEVLLALDPTSAVDSLTEATIADRLRTTRAGRTTLVTTASPLVLERADTVCFLVDGVVADQGTHRELLERNDAYRALVSRGFGDAPPETARP